LLRQQRLKSFAEELFNHLAKSEGLDWRALSRGLALELAFVAYLLLPRRTETD
jgi:hypothetical protein